MISLLAGLAALSGAQQEWPWWPFNTYRKNAQIYVALIHHTAFTSAEEMQHADINDRAPNGEELVLVTKREIEGLITDVDYLVHSMCYYEIPRSADADPAECHTFRPQDIEAKRNVLDVLNRAKEHCWSLPRSSDEMGCYLP